MPELVIVSNQPALSPGATPYSGALPEIAGIPEVPAGLLVIYGFSNALKKGGRRIPRASVVIIERRSRVGSGYMFAGPGDPDPDCDARTIA